MSTLQQLDAPRAGAVAEHPAVGTSGRWLRRVLVHVFGSVVVVLAVVTITFFALKLVPGDPALIILGASGAAPSEETVAATRAQYGLDQPVFIQFANYMIGLVRGDLGVSYIYKSPVAPLLFPQVWPTLQLTIVSIVLAWALSLALSLLTVRRGRFADAFGRGVEVLFAAIPPFWIALTLLVVFAFTLGWFPVAGSEDPRSIVLPALALAIPLAGFLAQVTRESFDDALSQPYALSARARGASDLRVRIVHALRHALLPGLTLSGWAIGSLISGAVVAEVIFARQGLGRSLVDAIVKRDAPIVLAVVLLIAVVYIVVNLIVDLLYRVVDPRIAQRED
ncbi:ABC transporter permease [Agromyces larvae]|uniref:ABC transporter permease n=1 Tax=Agromyces larvae TaxID=2929802 RepID=A0ABY4BV88_9MICO|nr:ABC transporter permease [Agromyces larvae]UOE43130.1 ABC transporter permease [Agromyces larvae]